MRNSARLRERSAVALLALGVDAAFGEPPAGAHPVVWMGHFLAFARNRWRGASPRARLVEGGAWWALGASASFAGGLLAERAASRLPAPVRRLALAALLKPALSARGLLGAVREVESPLARGDLPQARRLLAWHLVSRDTGTLSEDEVAGAAIESLAENLSDSVVAPVVWYVSGGLGLAYLYRFANTADASWGYRTPELEWSGKVAARADDLLGLAPARLTAALIALACVWPSASRSPSARPTAVWTSVGEEARLTASPNAGWPMSAASAALGVRLEKRGHYALGPDRRTPRAADVRAARSLATRVLALGVMLLAAGARRA